MSRLIWKVGCWRGLEAPKVSSRTQCCLFFREGPLQIHPRVGGAGVKVSKGKKPLSWLGISAEDQQAGLCGGCKNRTQPLWQVCFRECNHWWKWENLPRRARCCSWDGPQIPKLCEIHWLQHSSLYQCHSHIRTDVPPCHATVQW